MPLATTGVIDAGISAAMLRALLSESTCPNTQEPLPVIIAGVDFSNIFNALRTSG